MVILEPKFAKKAEIYAQMLNVEVHSRYLSRPDGYDNLPNISISKWFPGIFCIITYYSKHSFI